MRTKVIGAMTGLVLGYVFYRHYIAMIFLSVLGFSLSAYKKNDKGKVLQIEFKELLNGIYGELMVGQSFRNAVHETSKLHDFNHKKLKEAYATLNRHLQSGVSDVEAWVTFSETLDEAYIDRFVQTLEAVYLYSGHITYVIKQTIIEISDAIDLTLEIEVMIAAKRFEFMAMMCAPIALLGIMMLTQYDYVSILYETLVGRLMMTLILLGNLAAYIIGKRIINIR
ncbi:hypothetical protein EZV73_09290 [Acidaminobacter sp. JC074]|uniref:type II secretion system F family protein n=1 Tax=Acidaminobacter sp. JC074 TaxID=2530199 RepID=UPI001F0FCE85|nr:hypothetical protein [Acidaminobacter sp. JC074]MCH4887767.1 hypothetical protein [Acidaminobacter sp. JC074]